MSDEMEMAVDEFIDETENELTDEEKSDLDIETKEEGKGEPEPEQEETEPFFQNYKTPEELEQELRTLKADREDLSRLRQNQQIREYEEQQRAYIEKMEADKAAFIKELESEAEAHGLPGVYNAMEKRWQAQMEDRIAYAADQMVEQKLGQMLGPYMTRHTINTNPQFEQFRPVADEVSQFIQLGEMAGVPADKIMPLIESMATKFGSVNQPKDELAARRRAAGKNARKNAQMEDLDDGQDEVDEMQSIEKAMKKMAGTLLDI